MATGEDSVDAALAYSSVAEAHRIAGAPDRALPLYRKARALYEKALGPGSPAGGRPAKSGGTDPDAGRQALPGGTVDGAGGANPAEVCARIAWWNCPSLQSNLGCCV